MDFRTISTEIGFSDLRLFATNNFEITQCIPGFENSEIRTLQDLVPGVDFKKLQKMVSELQSGSIIQSKLRFNLRTNRTPEWHQVLLKKTDTGLQIDALNIDDSLRAKVFYETIESLSEIGSWEVDLLRETLLWSPTTYLIHDLNPHEYVPSLSDGLKFFQNKSFDIMSEAVRLLISSGTSYDLVLKLTTAQKREKTVRTVGKAEMIDGKVVRCYGTIQDISNEIKLREESQVGNERFHAVADNSPLILSFFDERGNFEWVNGEWVKVLGWSLEEMQGKDMIKEFYPDPSEYNKVLAFMTSGSKSWMRFRTRTKGGQYKYTQWTNVILSNGKGIGIGRDVDEQVKIDLEIENARKEFQQIFDLVQDPLIMINARGILTRVNPATSKILGYSEAELVMEPLELFVHPEDLETTQSALKKLDNKSSSIKFENRFRKKDATYRIFSWNVFLNSDTNIIYAAVRDITEEREQQLTLLNSANLASLGEMASGIAHEINNPLAIIKGKVDGIKRKIESPELDSAKIITELEKIDSTVDRISRIIMGLRKLARGDQEDLPVRVHLRSLVEDIFVISKERFLVNKIDLSYDIADDLVILCRPIQLEQVLINLLNNSLDAVCELEDGKRWVKIRAYLFNNLRVQIAVTDGGSGIPKNIVDRIMQPFFTTKPTGKGTGLGLSISKNLIESQGGLFQINKSSPNTEFLITLPIA